MRIEGAVVDILHKGNFLEHSNFEWIRIIKVGVNEPMFIPTFSYKKTGFPIGTNENK